MYNLLLLVILLFTSCKTFENNKIITENENNLNVETVIQFWDIADLLIQNKNVPKEKWEMFLNSSVNKIYYDVTGNDSNYLKKMVLNAFSHSEAIRFINND